MREEQQTIDTFLGEQDVIVFPDGLLGFEELTRFVLVEDGQCDPWKCLQSMDDPWVGFTVVDPNLLFVDYAFAIPEADKSELGVDTMDSVVVLSIVVVPENPLDTTVNLLAPIVINTATKLGKQVVLQGSQFSARQRLVSREDAA